MWIDLFISCNMAFAYLALLESMVVVLLQDKRTKTFFPQEWQWAIEKILWKKKADPSSAFGHRFGAPSVPLACILSCQPLPPVADILSYAAIEFRERAAVKSLETQGSFGSKAKEEERGSTRGSRQKSRLGKGRWEQLLNQMDNFPSSMAASKGDEDPLGEHPDKLADRLVFYEKLFFQVDTSEQGCADLNPLAHSSRSLSGLSMRPALTRIHPHRTCVGGFRWTRSVLCCPSWRCAPTVAAPSIILRPILTMTAA